ncbi:MAG: hypothetical protein MUF47_08585 [Porphyrobacter sp.]|nr:hypothetical protein [Porphyrobacter sp.]
MARNLFGPMGAFSNSAPATTAPQTQANPTQSSEPDVFGIARKYRIPPNIIIALQERGEDPEKAAQSIIAGLDAGKSFEDIVPKAVRIRASDIADEIEGITPEGGMGKALGVGIDVVQQGFGSALEGAGRSLGIDSLARYGARVAEDNAAEAASGARGLTGLGDVDGVGSAGSYVSETLAQQVPQLATSLGPVAAGAAIGSVVPGIGTAIGAGVGLGVAGIGNIAQFYGMNRERQKEANPGEEVNELAAFGTAIPQAATDLASDVLMHKRACRLPTPMQAGNIWNPRLPVALSAARLAVFAARFPARLGPRRRRPPPIPLPKLPQPRWRFPRQPTAAPYSFRTPVAMQGRTPPRTWLLPVASGRRSTNPKGRLRGPRNLRPT